MNDLVKIPIDASPTGTSLGLPSGLPFTSWCAIGDALKRIDGAIQWWIGDWLRYGEAAYGEKYEQAILITGYDYQTLRDYKYVAEAIDLSLRNDKLSFNHHKAIAGTPNPQIWLERAEQNAWSVAELRAAVKQSKLIEAGKAPQPERLRNYFLARERFEEEDLPWIRIPEIPKQQFKRPVVLINGAFELLHTGHMRLIFAARDKAATLVCALDSDARVARKGPGRPILTYIERATALGFMPIDYLIEIESDKDMKALIQTLKPDLRVQGYEYLNHPSRFPDIPKMFVRDGGLHTSTIIERCQKCPST